MSDSASNVQAGVKPATPAEPDKQNLEKAVANLQLKVANFEKGQGEIKELLVKLQTPASPATPAAPSILQRAVSGDADYMEVLPALAKRVLDQDKEVADAKVRSQQLEARVQQLSRPVENVEFERNFKQSLIQQNPELAPRADEVWREFISRRDSMLDPNELVPENTLKRITELAYADALKKVTSQKATSRVSASPSVAAARTDAGGAGGSETLGERLRALRAQEASQT